ncbi:hypothetical protein [Pelosinus baikalensis]|uniref:Uncharacterized protein n=1 Tax=Pelosinus baikalensis TaxID=2892015 RepID=A0ABS8HRX7_9FIRM|nr:hypothetical protein [Pelosinus baikalensis]MCC5465931.1 hypothetical protein [Pelosinus baikalensis]
MQLHNNKLTFYIFAAALGFTWLATVPPIIGSNHQVGGFLGAWLGGLAMEQKGSYMWM